MKLRALAVALPLALPLTLSFVSSAEAHFKLQEPADWLMTDDNGDPLGATGTQKQNPCGAGDASGAITTVRAGSTLHIKLTEAVPHGGHYRVALVNKLAPVSSDIPEPAVTLASGSCDTAAIKATPTAPVLADNLFPHTQAQAVAGKVWETDVTVPNQLGDATLQILEFMTPHPPQCFYHHCAQLKIVAADAGIDDDAGAMSPEGGPGTSGGDDGGATGTGPGAGNGDGNGGQAGNDTADGGSHAAPAAGTDESSGCSVGGGAAPSLTTLGALALTLASMLRRKRPRA